MRDIYILVLSVLIYKCFAGSWLLWKALRDECVY